MYQLHTRLYWFDLKFNVYFLKQFVRTHQKFILKFYFHFQFFRAKKLMLISLKAFSCRFINSRGNFAINEAFIFKEIQFISNLLKCFILLLILFFHNGFSTTISFLYKMIECYFMNSMMIL